MSERTNNDQGAESAAEKSRLTEVKYNYSNNWPAILERLGGSLVISTYQAGRLVVVGREPDGKTLAFSLHNFEQVMGVAVGGRQIAVGARRMIYQLRQAPQLAARVEPPGRYDDCYLTRFAHYTGPIHVHEMAWGSDELWFVNTLFSCLCTIDSNSSFLPRWKPPFISTLAGEDRCHLNGLALEDGRPRFVTAMAETDTAGGWRPEKARTGVILEVPSGNVLSRGLCMPHSPRVEPGSDRLWVLDSGRGQLATVDRTNGTVHPVATLPGYTRGLALAPQVGLAFVGLSRIRETAVFGGVPIAEDRDQLKCGVAAVNMSSGEVVATIEFRSGVEEIFDVQLLPGCRFPAVSGPNYEVDDTPLIWLASDPRWLTSDRP